MPFPEYLPTVSQMIHRLARQYGERELIVLDRRRLTYHEANTRSAQLARGLLAEGVGKGTRVGVLMPNGPDWLVSFLATTRIGAVLVPFNTFFQTRELHWILRHADVHTLLTSAHFLSHDYVERLESAAPGLAEQGPGPLHISSLPQLRSIYVFGQSDREWANSGEALAAAEGADPRIDANFLEAVEESVTPADAMAILYSSGSTSDPKGALHSHGALIRHSYNLSSSRDLTSTDRVWSPMPFFWVGGFTFALLGNMHAGATTLCEEAFAPETTLAFLERERVTVALGWPHFGKALAEHPSFAQRDLSTLRSGNIPDLLPTQIVPVDPELRQNALGMTETGGPHTRSTGVGALPETERNTFGVAVEGVEHRVVDPASGEILPAGTTGEICVRGYNLMQGLHKLERDEVFEPDGFYRTGDAGFFDDRGLLHFRGRLGDMIKTAGANVTPSEVEQVLVAFDEVKEAYVVGVDDVDREQSVEAAVVLEPGHDASAESLRERVKTELSAYKVPRHIFVYESGTLPFTDTGKIDKRRLKRQLVERLDG